MNGKHWRDRKYRKALDGLEFSGIGIFLIALAWYIFVAGCSV